MATSTVNTNKPIIPRGVDDRPVDKYNRAELYSGKALSFDGVNDFISTGTQTAFDMKSIAFHFIGVIDSSTNGFVMHPNDAQYNKGVMIGHYTSTLTDECLSIGDGTNFTTTKETFDDGIHFAVFSWDATNSKYKIFVNGIMRLKHRVELPWCVSVYKWHYADAGAGIGLKRVIQKLNNKTPLISR